MLVRSPEGIDIAVFESGSGPTSLVLIHGSTADHTRWAPVLDGLGAFARAFAVDRRGRGASGDVADYAIEQEAADVAAVVASVPRPVVLLGHSYGAVCSLLAMGEGLDVDALIVYEPPLALDGPITDPVVVAELVGLVEAGEYDTMLETFLRRVVGVSEEELAALRAAPAWAGRVEAARTLPRELDAVDALVVDRDAIARIDVPTTVLKGTESAPFLRQACDFVHSTVAGSRLVVLEGHGHAAMDTGPDLFVSAVREAIAGAV